MKTVVARFSVKCHLVKLPEGRVRFLIFTSRMDQREAPNYFRQGVLHVLGQTDTHKVVAFARQIV